LLGRRSAVALQHDGERPRHLADVERPVWEGDLDPLRVEGLFETTPILPAHGPLLKRRCLEPGLDRDFGFPEAIDTRDLDGLEDARCVAGSARSFSATCSIRATARSVSSL
jgi:hypothetical protein